MDVIELMLITYTKPPLRHFQMWFHILALQEMFDLHKTVVRGHNRRNEGMNERIAIMNHTLI